MVKESSSQKIYLTSASFLMTFCSISSTFSAIFRADFACSRIVAMSRCVVLMLFSRVLPQRRVNRSLMKAKFGTDDTYATLSFHSFSSLLSLASLSVDSVDIVCGAGPAAARILFYAQESLMWAGDLLIMFWATGVPLYVWPGTSH